MPSNVAAMRSRLPDLQTTKGLRSKFVTMLVYGGARSGKTSLALTAENPLVIATELGDTMGLQSLSDSDIPYVPCESADDFDAIVAELVSNQEQCTYGGRMFTTVFVDSYTGLGALWMEAGAKAVLGDGEEMLWDRAAKKDPRAVYAYLAEKGRGRTKKLFDTRAHVVMLCREGLLDEGEGKDKITFAVPELPGQKLSRELPGWPDATLRMRFLKTGAVEQRVFVTQTEMRAVAGMRLPPSMHVPKYIRPNIALVARLVNGDATAIAELTFPKQAGA